MSIDLVAWGDETSGLSLGSKKSQGGSTALSFRYSDPIKHSGAAMMEIYQSAGQNNQPAGPVSDIKQTQMILLKSNNSFFFSSDGSSGGYLQSVLLRRVPTP